MIGHTVTIPAVNTEDVAIVGNLTILTAGSSIMFSVRPIGPLDGGEIWVWDKSTGGPAAFLVHGGHTWDTAHDVSGHFGGVDENINAMEAVPEPMTICLLGLGGLGLLRRKR